MQATRENVMKRLLLLFLLCFGLALPGVAADGTSFNPTTISVKSVGASIPVGTVITWPSNSWPSDRDNWLECNGQSISSAVYPELVGIIGNRVPDYRGRFLRGIQSGHSVGETVANTLKSHNHTQPTHTHSFSGQLVSTALSGTAAGQKYSSTASLSVSGTAAGQSYLDRHMEAARSPISGSGGGTAAATYVYGSEYGVDYFFAANNSYRTANSSSVSGTAKGTVSGTAQSSSVSGNLRNGAVSGSIGAGGGNPTDYTGEAETAPDHIYVRCLIRAKP